MYAILQGHNFINEVQSISQLFFHNEKFILTDTPVETGVTIASILTETDLTTALYENGRLIGTVIKSRAANVSKSAYEEYLTRANHPLIFLVAESVYEICMKYYPKNIPWGMLVGVRPVKLVRDLKKKGLSDKEVLKLLTGIFRVDNEKTSLCLKIADNSRRLPIDDKAVSLYVSVPFCPSICLYCSFSSYLYAKHKKTAEFYIKCLTKELGFVAEYLNKQGKSVQSLYIGGGTPTSLELGLFNDILGSIRTLGLSPTTEYTVEAGRPDTICEENLSLMKNYGVTRISVNPQTLNDDTLVRIGRNHTSNDFFRAYEQASNYDFIINIDLIMGLMGETLKDTNKTLSMVEKLYPVNLTIHTLSVKRASKLKETLNENTLINPDIDQMLFESAKTAEKIGLYPYYLYRQKNTLGNLENIGYSAPQKECLYNVYVTDELQTIIAVGAGGVTKHYKKETNLIRRIYNVKAPEEYARRVDQMIERKKKLYAYDS